MAEFLTTNGTSYFIEKIIIEATETLTLISPFLQLSKTFFERLKDASARNVKIRIVYGKDELKPNEKNSLADLDNLELYYFENLHAKCYFNEEEMVITSMNMYEFSEKNNREMGVYISRITDEKLFQKAIEETLSILKSSEISFLEKKNRKLANQNLNSKGKVTEKSFSVPERGYCIRCGERIPYYVEKPYCFSCYFIWAQYENFNFPETYCHACGEFVSTSMEKPVCYTCYRNYEKK